MQNIKMLTIAIFSVCLISTSGFALTIETPINYDIDNLVGTADPGNASVSIANEALWAQQILDLAFNTEDTIVCTLCTPKQYSVMYRTHNSDEYDGTIIMASGQQSAEHAFEVESGWEYAIAKYDGQNAGYVLFYLGGEAVALPEYSDTIWTNGSEQGYQISHFTTFNSVSTSVPEPNSTFMVAMGLVGLFGYGWCKRKL